MTDDTRTPEPLPPSRFGLPEHTTLAWLEERADELSGAVADPASARHAEALDLVATYDPPTTGRVDRVRARRVLARAFGFAGWEALRAHLDRVARWTSTPEPTPVAGEPDVDTFLRLVLLSYGHYDRGDLERAAAMLRAEPPLATRSPHAMAACGRADELAAVLASDPDAAIRPGGPHAWAPLLHVAYARLALVAPDLAGDPLVTARVLLDHGADPDSGFLWHGLTPPFTAITGALGGGERDEPPHPQGVALAELLLERGADPNDAQGLYNRMFGPDDSHLPPLLEHGLGRPHDSAWLDRLGGVGTSPEEMVTDHLCFAAEHGYTERVRLLLDHAVDPSGPGEHPVLGARTAYQIAVRAGHREAAELIARAGADVGSVSDVDRLLGAALAGDAPEVRRLLAGQPGLAARAVAERPDAMAVAGERRGIEALGLLIGLGFDVDAAGEDRRTALHQAAFRGATDVCRWLVAEGADRNVRDCHYDGTPAGWAAHAGHQALAAELAP